MLYECIHWLITIVFSTHSYSLLPPPLNAWTLYGLPLSDVILMESFHYLYCHSVTLQSKHTSANKIALKVQHRKPPQYGLSASVPEKKKTVIYYFHCCPEHFHHYSDSHFVSLITGSSAQLCPATVGLVPKQEALRLLCHHTLLVHSLVITLSLYSQ